MTVFVIDVGGLYYFKTVDAVGNEKVFTVMLDLQVNFTVLGSYVLVDNVYVSKDWLQLTSDEVITAVVTESNTGIDVKLNEKSTLRANIPSH